MSPVFAGNIDVALVTFYAFVVFFAGLVVYLNRESRREGFPLEDDVTGRLDSPALIMDDTPKLFRLPFGHGTRSTADYGRHPVNLPGVREPFSGAPLRPTGNPLTDGLGPAAWAERQHVPDLDMEGHARIVPLSTIDALWIDGKDADPRGMDMVALDNVVVGKITDIWVDRAERIIRYLEVAVAGAEARHVLVPMAMSVVQRRRNRVVCDALNAAQYAGAPGVPSGNVITFYEEERAQAYFGGGYLYATRERQEPVL